MLISYQILHEIRLTSKSKKRSLIAGGTFLSELRKKLMAFHIYKGQS